MLPDHLSLCVLHRQYIIFLCYSFNVTLRRHQLLSLILNFMIFLDSLTTISRQLEFSAGAERAVAVRIGLAERDRTYVGHFCHLRNLWDLNDHPHRLFF